MVLEASAPGTYKGREHDSEVSGSLDSTNIVSHLHGNALCGKCVYTNCTVFSNRTVLLFWVFWDIGTEQKQETGFSDGDNQIFT